MEKIVFIKKKLPKDNPDIEISCEYCCFFNVCIETMNMQDILGECEDGVYYEIED